MKSQDLYIESNIKKIIEENKYEYVKIQSNKNLYIIKDFITNSIKIQTNDSEILLYYGLILDIIYFKIKEEIKKKSSKNNLAKKNKSPKIIPKNDYDDESSNEFEETEYDDEDEEDNIHWNHLYTHSYKSNNIPITISPSIEEAKNYIEEVTEYIDSKIKIEQYYNNHTQLIISYYTKSIEQNNIYAMIFLGDFYGKIQNIEMMEHYYKMAISFGDCTAAYKLVVHYRNINNYEYLIDHYKFIIDNINCEKFNSLAKYYENNSQIHLMTECYGFSLSKNDETAMCEMAKYYKEKNDSANMFKMLQRAISQNSCEAMYQMGKCVGSSGTQQDIKSAVKYYIDAAKQNHYKSMVKLCYYYYQQNDGKLLLEYYFKISQKCSDKIHETMCRYIYKTSHNTKKFIKKIILIGYNNKIQTLLNFCVNTIMDKQIKLSQKYYNIVKNINFISKNFNYMVIFNIYKITGNFYNENQIIQYYSNFMDIINVPQKSNILSRDIMIKIAGYIFE